VLIGTKLDVPDLRIDTDDFTTELTEKSNGQSLINPDNVYHVLDVGKSKPVESAVGASVPSDHPAAQSTAVPAVKSSNILTWLAFAGSKFNSILASVGVLNPAT
jgi:hypothetical protein